MATVHLARSRDGDDWLAIKRIHPHLADHPDVQRMFLNEARLLAQLDHPVVCGILDASLIHETPYLVMRYLHGVSLSALITRLLAVAQPVPVNLMAYIAATLCDGLHYAHQAVGDDGQPLNLVHRDISPQNIFLTFMGGVHLLDFGVAKAAGFEDLTRTGRVKGKYAYMSPEQVAGQVVDRRSDIFSLGIVLWESLTGRHLFKRRNDIDTLRAIKSAAVPAPSELNPEVPQQLDAIVARSLVADRRRRFSSAEALGSALWRYLTAAKPPVGADELSEALSLVFPRPPTPEERAAGAHRHFPGWPREGGSMHPDASAAAIVDSPDIETQAGAGPHTEISPFFDPMVGVETTAAEAPHANPSAFTDHDEDTAAEARPSRAAKVTRTESATQRENDVPAATEVGIASVPTSPLSGSNSWPTTPAVLTDRPAFRPHPRDGHRPSLNLEDVQSTLTEVGDTAASLPPKTHRVPLADMEDGFRHHCGWLLMAGIGVGALLIVVIWAIASG